MKTTILSPASLSMLCVMIFVTSSKAFPSSILTPQHHHHQHHTRRGSAGLTASQLLQIAPSASTCEGAPFPDECRTADQAIAFINDSFQKYGITDSAEMAALVSLMALESGEFKYNKNHFPSPGRPGQGTRNMQSAAFNVLYATSIPELQAQVSQATGGQPAASLTADSQNAVRQLVLQEEFDFGSAAWFLTTQCGPAVRTALQTQGESGWELYISGCVGTTVTPDRSAYWTKANAALGVS